MKIIRIALAALLGGVLSLASSFAWFRWTHHSPVQRVSVKYLIASCVVGAFCSIAAGFIAASVGNSRRAAFGTALITLALGGVGVAESFVASSSGSLELTWVSIIVMVPATVAGGILWKRSGTRAA